MPPVSVPSTARPSILVFWKIYIKVFIRVSENFSGTKPRSLPVMLFFPVFVTGRMTAKKISLNAVFIRFRS